MSRMHALWHSRSRRRTTRGEVVGRGSPPRSARESPPLWARLPRQRGGRHPSDGRRDASDPHRVARGRQWGRDGEDHPREKLGHPPHPYRRARRGKRKRVRKRRNGGVSKRHAPVRRGALGSRHVGGSAVLTGRGSRRPRAPGAEGNGRGTTRAVRRERPVQDPQKEGSERRPLRRQRGDSRRRWTRRRRPRALRGAHDLHRRHERFHRAGGRDASAAPFEGDGAAGPHQQVPSAAVATHGSGT